MTLKQNEHMLRPWLNFPSSSPANRLEGDLDVVCWPVSTTVKFDPFEPIDNPQRAPDNPRATPTQPEGTMSTPKTERKTTYKVVSNADGATVAIYEAKSASAAAKQHLESLGHAVSVANSSEVFSYMKGQRDLFRDAVTHGTDQ